MKPSNHIRKLMTLHEDRHGDRMTLEKLAEETGISTSQLSRMQSGKRGLSLEYALLIARALKVSVGEVDPKFSDILPITDAQLASLEKELVDVLPKLSPESRRSVLEMALRLHALEERGPSE